MKISKLQLSPKLQATLEEGLCISNTCVWSKKSSKNTNTIFIILIFIFISIITLFLPFPLVLPSLLHVPPCLKFMAFFSLVVVSCRHIHIYKYMDIPKYINRVCSV